MIAKPDRPTEITIVYNHECPICSWEIDHYRAHAEAVGAPVAFLTIDEGAPLLGVAKEQATRRLHALVGGERLSGVPAFIALWRALPRYRWLARTVDRPALRRVGGWLYDRALAPALYAMHRRREARKARAAG